MRNTDLSSRGAAKTQTNPIPCEQKVKHTHIKKGYAAYIRTYRCTHATA